MQEVLAEEEVEFNQHYPKRCYAKMETCGHEHPIAFLKCKKCGLAISEESIDEFIRILVKEKERLQARKVKEYAI